MREPSSAPTPAGAGVGLAGGTVPAPCGEQCQAGNDQQPGRRERKDAVVAHEDVPGIHGPGRLAPVDAARAAPVTLQQATVGQADGIVVPVGRIP